MESRGVQSDNPMEEPPLEEKVKDFIYHIIHRNFAVKEIFLPWAEMSSIKQAIFKRQANLSFKEAKIGIVDGIIGGMQVWNDIQDTQGACGFSAEEPEQFPMDYRQQATILNIVCEMKKILETIDNKALLNRSLADFNVKFRNHKIVFIKKQG